MEQTKMQLTVIKIAKDAAKGEDCKIKAHGALEFVIFMRKFKKGQVKSNFYINILNDDFYSSFYLSWQERYSNNNFFQTR
jgi:LDH2 family malate/lactate/ureidoglycolate dehydrogenase